MAFEFVSYCYNVVGIRFKCCLSDVTYKKSIRYKYCKMNWRESDICTKILIYYTNNNFLPNELQLMYFLV